MKRRFKDPTVAKPRWFTMTDYFNPEKINTISKADPKMYLLGSIDDLIVLQIVGDLTEDQMKHVTQTSRMLQKQGRKVLIVDDFVQFMRVRACTPEEAKSCNEADTEKGGVIAGSYADSSDGLRSLAEGAGASSLVGEPGSAARGDDEPQVNDDPKLPEDGDAQGPGEGTG
jgi:hypothetical protein